jgi:branched-subunit amino acid transport protein
MSIWLTIIIAGILTYSIRLSFIMLSGKINMPRLVERSLRFVPPAVLTAIFLPELLIDDANFCPSLGNARLLAGLLAIMVAWRTKNVIYTIISGMLALWLLQFLFH